MGGDGATQSVTSLIWKNIDFVHISNFVLVLSNGRYRARRANIEHWQSLKLHRSTPQRSSRAPGGPSRPRLEAKKKKEHRSRQELRARAENPHSSVFRSKRQVIRFVKPRERDACSTQDRYHSSPDLAGQCLVDRDLRSVRRKRSRDGCAHGLVAPAGRERFGREPAGLA